MDYRRFFRRPAEEVARDLLGRYLVRETRDLTLVGRIIQTGAYEESSETPSREGMLYAPGKIFVMPFRGNHFLNIATDRSGKPSCVSIRQVALSDKVLDGPGKIGDFFGIELLDGLSFMDEFQLLGDSVDLRRTKKMVKGTSDNCLGYYSIKK